MTYTTFQLAELLDVNPATIRNWTAEFADLFSDSATPPKGRARVYNDADLRILTTVAVLREQAIELAEIGERLEQGFRAEPLEFPETAENDAPAADLPPQIAESFNHALTTLERQNSGLLDKIEQLHQRLLDTEKRATAAETELRLLKAAVSAPPAEKSFWDRLLGR